MMANPCQRHAMNLIVRVGDKLQMREILEVGKSMRPCCAAV
jgi:hypothetical protein